MVQIKAFIAFLFGCLIFTNSLGQTLESVFYMGYSETDLIFSGDIGNHYEDLYTYIEADQNFKLFEKNRVQPKYQNYYVGYFFVEDDFRSYAVRNTTSSYMFAFELNKEFKTIELAKTPQGIAYYLKNNIVYFGNQDDNPDIFLSLPIQELNLETGDLKELPIKGVNPVVKGDYLFYADYPDPKQFDMVFDIYQVRIGDWEKPERIFSQNYFEGWIVSDDRNYLLVEIIEFGYKPQMAVYNISEKRYAIVESKALPRSIFYSKSKGKFCFYDMELIEGERRFVYLDMPTVFHYIPTWLMDFGDSFINTYWLDEAKENELKELDESQLRLLRNAIFARKGWRFQSDELKNFFGQFDWYTELLKVVEKNEDIQLTNDDKYRSQLIKGIEDMKDK